jgi:hypothetical protein
VVKERPDDLLTGRIPGVSWRWGAVEGLWKSFNDPPDPSTQPTRPPHLFGHQLFELSPVRPAPCQCVHLLLQLAQDKGGAPPGGVGARGWG